MEEIITTREQLNAAVTTLHACVLDMCNTTDSERVTEDFIAIKDKLVALYRYNVNRVEGINENT